MYSAIKISANVPDLNSVLKPETNSDSPSAKSNGVRLVSARHVIIHVVKRGHKQKVNWIDPTSKNLLSLNVDIIIKGVKITNAILTSYEIVWAILRNAPNNEYFLFDDHPANNVV